MGWRKVATKYCQIIRAVNRVKRFIYACLSKRFKDDLDDAIVVDECTVELKLYNPTNWRKDDQELRAAGGKLGKPKHGIKVHLFGGISRKGLTPLIAFQGTMCSGYSQNWLSFRRILDYKFRLREFSSSLKSMLASDFNISQHLIG